MKERPIILVGGGTGGHIYPLVALGEELAKRKMPFIYVGGAGYEKNIINNQKWPYRQISTGKFRRYWSIGAIFSNIIDLFKLKWGFWQSVGIILGSGSNLIISKGGYVSLPVIMAAKLLGRRIFIHESDTVLGLSNRFGIKFATLVMTAFPEDIYPKSKKKYIQTGIPLRSALRQAATLKTPQKNRPLILVMGGIQGAKSINSLIEANLDKMLEFADIIHITGEAEIGKYKKIADTLENKNYIYKPFSFIERELPYYFQVADLVISRASATTIAEAALFGKAMYLIPLPTSASDHQLKNAKVLAEKKAAVMKEELQLTNDKFFQDIAELINRSEYLGELGNNLRNYFNESKSIEIIMEKIEETQNGKN